MESLAYNQKDAAAALGLSVPHFRRHVRPHLKACYIAGATRYSVVELQRFLDKAASSP